MREVVRRRRRGARSLRRSRRKERRRPGLENTVNSSGGLLIISREKVSNLEQFNRFDNDRCEGTSTIDNVAEVHLETIWGRKEKKR